MEFKEGGYGWFIVAASFTLHFVLYGLQYSYGVLLTKYIHSPIGSQTSPIVLSLIGSTGISLIATFGFITGQLADRYGYRLMALVGSFMFCLGYLFASFSDQVWQLFLAQGILVGIGSSIGFFPAVSIPSQWFFKRRGLATGICVSGSGVGGLIFSLITYYSLEEFDIAWTLRLVGLISLLLAVPSSLILRERVPSEPRDKLLDFCLFKNLQFTTLWVGGFISTLGILVPFYMMPLYANENQLSNSQGALLVAILNGGNAVGRVLLGLLADKWGAINIMLIGMLFTSLFSLVLWPLSTNFSSLIVFSIIYGFVSGSYMSLLSVISSQLFGLQNIATTNGLLYVAVGIPCFLGNPIATFLLAYGFYSVILFSGISGLIGTLFILHLKYQLYYQPKKATTPVILLKEKTLHF